MAVNETTINFYFTPQQAKTYSDTFDITAPDYTSDTISFSVAGVGILETYDVLMQGGETWDLTSYLFFERKVNQILKLWQDNKHLSDDDKRSFAVAGGTPLLRVPLTTEEKEEDASTNYLLPPWKQ